MKIVKVFNNNIVATITKGKKEALVTGAGIGFGKKIGDILDESKITKCYYMQNMKKDRLYQLLESVPVLYLEISEAILDKAQASLQEEINDSILTSLTDHIYFSIQRSKKKEVLPNLILNEVKALYPKEFAIGKWAILFIKAKTGVELPEDEAGYIAIHILNAMMKTNEDVSDTIIFMKEMSDIIEQSLSIHFDRESLDYSRLMTHLKYFYQRMMRLQHNDIGDVEDMYHLLIHKHKDMKICIRNIESMLQVEYDYACSIEEKVYLMMHIIKILHQT